MAIPISYNVRSVLQRPMSTLTSVVGIAFVVAILIAALALAQGFSLALSATGSKDNVIVLRKGADSEISSAVSREAMGILKAMPEVATDAAGNPLFSADVVVLINKERLGMVGSSNITVRGIDATALNLRDNVKIANGRMFTPGADEVIVGERLEDRFMGMRLGDKVKFGQRDFTIVGHFSAGDTAFESEIWGDSAVLMPVFRGDVFQSVTFRLAPGATLAALKQKMEADPRLKVEVKIEQDFYTAQSEMLGNIIRFAGGFITFIMGVGAVFGAMNTMYAAVSARAREIAVLLTLGFRPMALMVSFTIESVVIALAGGVLGCIIALPINGVTTSTTNFSSFSEIGFGFSVTPHAMMVGIIVAAVIGLFGGLLPARRAAKQPIISGLRGRG